MKAKYTLHKRGKVWYYRLPSDPKRTPHSTRESNKGRAALFVETEVLGLSPVGQSSVDSALGGVGVTAHGVDFADHGHIYAGVTRSHGRPHPRKAGPYHKHVVVEHPPPNIASY